MRSAMAMMIIMMLAAGVLAEPAKAATVDKITPSKGKVGRTVVVHGSGFKAGPVTVKFGQSPAEGVKTLDDKKIKVIVPEKNVLDPNPVKVTVTVAGVPALGDAEFLYHAPGQEPVIESVEPESTIVGQPFAIKVTGSDFTTPQGREPNQVVLVGPETVWGTVVSIESATCFVAEFPPVAIVGDYTLLVGFSDGTEATAENFWVN